MAQTCNAGYAMYSTLHISSASLTNRARCHVRPRTCVLDIL